MTRFSFVLLLALALGMGHAAVATDGTTERTPAEIWREEPLTVFSAQDVTLEDFQWIARPVVVFADTEADPRFQEQLALLTDRTDELLERDVVIIADADPSARTDIRRELRPRGFMMTLIAKDGRVNLRKPVPWDVREIAHAIDKWPLRQQEIRDAKGIGG